MLETELVHQPGFPFDKVFSVVVSCRHAFGKFHPPTSFKYKFLFTNNGGKDKTKTKEGAWFYLDAKVDIWDTVLYSDLVNPFSNWIALGDGNDCIVIVLRLMRWINLAWFFHHFGCVKRWIFLFLLFYADKFFQESNLYYVQLWWNLPVKIELKLGTVIISRRFLENPSIARWSLFFFENDEFKIWLDLSWSMADFQLAVLGLF